MSAQEDHTSSARHARRTRSSPQGDRNECLTTARRERGWSQADLAARAGITQRQVSLLERLAPRGKTTLDWAARVAEALDLPIDVVMPAEPDNFRLARGGGQVRSMAPAALARVASPASLTSNNPGREVEDREEVEMLLRFVEPKDREVLVSHFGIGPSRPRTLAEIGSTQDPPVCRQRIRQRIDRAIERLRAAVRGLRLHANEEDGGTLARSLLTSGERDEPMNLMSRLRWQENDIWFGKWPGVSVSIHRIRPAGGGRPTFAWYALAGTCLAQGSAQTLVLAESAAHYAVDAIRGEIRRSGHGKPRWAEALPTW